MKTHPSTMNNAADLLKATDPLAIFSAWWEAVKKHPGIQEPTAMTLATVDAMGQPSLRTVLLKQFSPTQGFVFFTNYQSKKAQDLKLNPKAALLFYWDPLFRQVKVEGFCEKISRADSEAYWNSRPQQSQLAGWVSKQSQPVTGQLSEEYEAAEKRWAGQPIPCPENWGGFRLQPQSIEFWIGHRYRLHDRVKFIKKANNWVAQQLYP